MSKHRIADAPPSRGVFSVGGGKRTRAVLASTLTMGLLAGGFGATAAMAGSGGGGTIGTGGGTSGNFSTHYAMFDELDAAHNPTQGRMTDSMNWFFAKAYPNNPAPDTTFTPNAHQAMQRSCGAALAKAEERRSAGTPAGNSRVVGMYWASDKKVIWGNGAVHRDAFKALYDKWVGEGRGSIVDNLPDLPAYYSAIERGFYEGYNDIGASFGTTICIALNSEEPPMGPVDYTLSLSTDKADTFSLAGATNAVSDRINASANGSPIRENLSATTTLHYGGVDSNARSVSKTSTIANEGTSVSPSFTPGDFGWTSWPSGKFWYDVSVPKQNQMTGDAIHYGGDDARENWSAAPVPPRKVLTSGNPADPLGADEVLVSGMFYNAEVTANTNGYASSMTIRDTILVDEVFIGSSTADVLSAVYLLDPAGNRVANAEFAIDRATAGRVTVTGTVRGIPNEFQAREYRLVVPTYVLPTKTDYTIKDDSGVCYTGLCLEGNSEQTRKVTPKPDKVWVIDETGALNTADPNHTNQQGADGKTFAPGSKISAVVNGSIPAKLAENMSSYSITDNWTGAAKYVDFSNASLAKVFLDGRDVTSQFDVKVVGTTTVATAKAEFLNSTKGRASAATVKLFISGEFRSDYNTDGKEERLTNAGNETWNNQVVETNVPPVFTVTPQPDKAWVLDADGALTTADPDWTNAVGADNKVFLQNDAVSAVVNGKIPGNLGSALTNYALIDDWSDAARYIDFTDASLADVYFETAVGSNRYAKVTSDFDVVVSGSVTTATAKAGSMFLANTLGQAGDRKTKLVISGKFRDDFDTQGETVKMVNKGSETWNNKTEPTNEPPVYTWTPDPNKQVLGSAEESGDNTHADIDGLSVWPGQKLEYSVGVDLRIPSGTARGVKSLAVEDIYDPKFTPDKSSIEFWDSRDVKNPRPVPRSQYKIVFDEAAHKFTATFTEDWIKKNVNEAGANSEWLTQGWLTMRFTGTVSPDIAEGSTVQNQAFQIINDARTATEIPVVEIPVVNPDKEDLNTDLVDIDGKTVVEGDIVLYRLTLDANPSRDKLAYNVHKLGMVDDFDEEYLTLDPEAIKVAEKDTGADVTDKFNIQVKDGIAYIFAKQVDTENVYGGIIPGDPQPEDLAVYDQAKIRPLDDPIIDQVLLGKQYWITLPTVVKKETDGYVIENQARQNIQNTHKPTRIVSNPLKDIDPDKDVVVSEETKDDSINEAEIKLYSTFNYRLNSSEIPANRAYKASQWSMSDTFDRVHDAYTGIWAIYANHDIYDGETLIFKKGALLQDSAAHESEPYNEFFEVTFNEATYTLTVTATQKYLDLINTRMDLANAFSVYTKMERIAPSEKVENKVTESYNNFDRESNIVWTSTPENPAIEVIKFTLSEGEKDGDRNDARLAYEMTEDELKKSGVEVGIRFTNTGDTPLTNVTITDTTHEGLFGSVEGLVCAVPAEEEEGEGEEPAEEEAGEVSRASGKPAVGSDFVPVVDEDGTTWVMPSSITDLAIGEAVLCKGTLKGMKPGMLHGDTVVVTGDSVFTGKTVKDEDPWFAKAPSTPGIELIKYTLEEGREAGDRNEYKNALELSAEQAKNGLQIGFDIENIGDEDLKDLNFSDLTNDATTGTVENVMWAIKLAEGEVAGDGVPTVQIGEDTYKLMSLDMLAAHTLAVGEQITLVGTLMGVEESTGHQDTATIEGTAVYSGTKVSDTDPWNAKLPSVEVPNPPCDCETPAPPKGAVTGDPLASAGTSPWLYAGAALLLLLAGAGAVMLRRRSLASVVADSASDMGAVPTGTESEWVDRGE